MERAGRVLIVDDEAANRLVVKTILSGASYDVSEAADAFTALDRIDREPPHAVLLDIKMPGMDGLGLLGNLRQRGIDVPVVVLTGHGDEFTASSCLQAGADAFLNKPPDRATLLLTVQSAVRRGRLAEENRNLRGAGEEPPLIGNSPRMEELREGVASAKTVPALRMPTSSYGAFEGSCDSWSGKVVMRRHIRVDAAEFPASAWSGVRTWYGRIAQFDDADIVVELPKK